VLINKAVEALTKKLKDVLEKHDHKKKKLGLLGKIKAKLLYHFRPDVTVRGVAAGPGEVYSVFVEVWSNSWLAFGGHSVLS
jgi:hypothetical protein